MQPGGQSRLQRGSGPHLCEVIGGSLSIQQHLMEGRSGSLRELTIGDPWMTAGVGAFRPGRRRWSRIGMPLQVHRRFCSPSSGTTYHAMSSARQFFSTSLMSTRWTRICQNGQHRRHTHSHSPGSSVDKAPLPLKGSTTRSLQTLTRRLVSRYTEPSSWGLGLLRSGTPRYTLGLRRRRTAGSGTLLTTTLTMRKVITVWTTLQRWRGAVN